MPCAGEPSRRGSRRAGGVVAGEAVRRRRLVKAESVGARRGKGGGVGEGRGGEERRGCSKQEEKDGRRAEVVPLKR